MRIGLVTDPCDPKKPGGLGRCVFELARSLITATPQHSFTVYSKSEFPVQHVERRLLPKRVWVFGTKYLDPTVDVYVFFTPVIPLFFRPRRSIVVAEDFAYLELPRQTIREKVLALSSYLMHRRSLRIADKVVCISRTTMDAAVHYFGISPEKCIVIPLAAMPLPQPVVIPDLPDRFFFFAGVLKERKNLENILRGFASFVRDNNEYDFCIAGKTEGQYYVSLKMLVSELGIEKRVHFLDYLNDGQIAYMYAHAAALVFASKVEGFGMPLLEAFAADLPVITSDRGALAEVAGGAALLVNPDSPEALAHAMVQIATDEKLCTELQSRGRKRAGSFSWESSGRSLSKLL